MAGSKAYVSQCHVLWIRNRQEGSGRFCLAQRECIHRLQRPAVSTVLPHQLRAVVTVHFAAWHHLDAQGQRVVFKLALLEREPNGGVPPVDGDHRVLRDVERARAEVGHRGGFLHERCWLKPRVSYTRVEGHKVGVCSQSSILRWVAKYTEILDLLGLFVRVILFIEICFIEEFAFTVAPNACL